MEGDEMRAIAVIECCEEIPCNPCVKACPHHAIRIEGGIHHIPQLDAAQCVGCGICVAKCSGQAIFVVEKGEKTGKVSFPYEMYPLPTVGLCVSATDRDGQVVCDGVVTGVRTTKGFDRTSVVTVEVQADAVDVVRGFRFKEE